MAVHETSVNASGMYTTSGSDHDEARFWLRYSSGGISYLCPAEKNVPRLTAAIAVPMMYCAIANRRKTSGWCPDATVVITTQLPAAQETNATWLNSTAML